MPGLCGKKLKTLPRARAPAFLPVVHPPCLPLNQLPWHLLSSESSATNQDWPQSSIQPWLSCPGHPFALSLLPCPLKPLNGSLEHPCPHSCCPTYGLQAQIGNNLFPNPISISSKGPSQKLNNPLPSIEIMTVSLHPHWTRPSGPLPGVLEGSTELPPHIKFTKIESYAFLLKVNEFKDTELFT